MEELIIAINIINILLLFETRKWLRYTKEDKLQSIKSHVRIND